MLLIFTVDSLYLNSNMTFTCQKWSGSSSRETEATSILITLKEKNIFSLMSWSNLDLWPTLRSRCNLSKCTQLSASCRFPRPPELLAKGLSWHESVEMFQLGVWRASEETNYCTRGWRITDLFRLQVLTSSLTCDLLPVCVSLSSRFSPWIWGPAGSMRRKYNFWLVILTHEIIN